MCFEVFLSFQRIILVNAGFIVDKFQRSPIFSCAHISSLMLIKSLLEILCKTEIEFKIFLTLQYICVIHIISSNLTGQGTPRKPFC